MRTKHLHGDEVVPGPGAWEPSECHAEGPGVSWKWNTSLWGTLWSSTLTARGELPWAGLALGFCPAVPSLQAGRVPGLQQLPAQPAWG